MPNDLMEKLVPRPVPQAIALAGPTASGKTALALAIAQQFEVEIISVDSALVYRGMDIGTAKPTPAELALVPHHLINIRDPLQAYSAAEFVRDAQQLIVDIHARGKLALLVGGTMLYFKAFLDGIDDMPKADPLVRAQLEQQARDIGWPAMHAELMRVDPVTATRLKPQDSQRIQRALEVYRVSGQPMASFQKIKNENNTFATNSIAEYSYLTRDNGKKSTIKPDNFTPLISLEPLDRAWLHTRIEQRFDAMTNAGFLDEVRALRARGDLNPDLPAMRCVGYRQAWQALDEGAVESSPKRPGIPTWQDKGVYATRQLAKRQITWLRSMPTRHVVPADAPDAQNRVLDLVRQFMKGVR